MNMVIIGPFILTLFSGLSTLLGLLVIRSHFIREEKGTIYFLSISLGFMILISVFELLPSSVIHMKNNYKSLLGLIIIILVFLLGYNSTVFIDRFIKEDNSLCRIGLKNSFVLIFHNILEGVVVYTSSLASISIGIKLCLAIMIHNISEGISIALPIYKGGGGVRKILIYLLIASLSEPFGALLSYIILKGKINELIISYILIFISGLMISISLNDILKELISYKYNKYIIYGIITSLILYMIVF